MEGPRGPLVLGGWRAVGLAFRRTGRAGVAGRLGAHRGPVWQRTLKTRAQAPGNPAGPMGPTAERRPMGPTAERRPLRRRSLDGGHARIGHP